MVETKRVYKLEETLYKNNQFKQITKQRPLNYLIKFAQNLWREEQYNHQFPDIRFGKGIQQYSWTDGITIELSKSQRDILTLIHEIVHTLGFDYHNDKFLNKELDLLERYTKIKGIKDIISNN